MGEMSQAQWDAVERFLTDTLVPMDPALTSALEDSQAAGLPQINVTPNEGKLLHMLALSQSAGAILEVGTLGGFSAIWLARALPAGGRLISLELEPLHAQVARRNLDRAQLSSVVEVRQGPAADSLSDLVREGAGPFDLVFIDADKPSNPDYFRWALRLTRAGSLIVVDNVVRQGDVTDADSSDPAVRGTREVLELMGRESRVTATAIQTVGSKGYDGFALALVLEGPG